MGDERRSVVKFLERAAIKGGAQRFELRRFLSYTNHFIRASQSRADAGGATIAAGETLPPPQLTRRRG